MMEDKEREVEEMKQMLLEKEDKMDHLLKLAAKILANNTEYAAMISAPQYHRNKLKFIQLSRVDINHILAVIVAGRELLSGQQRTAGDGERRIVRGNEFGLPDVSGR